MHYIMNVGDAWFAQVPREGNIYVRSGNMHDTATRCTACHPSSFSTEANLVAHRNGYPIRSKSNFQYVIDRLYNSITPLYGDDGLYWQRFIAIPLQAQGKQGGDPARLRAAGLAASRRRPSSGSARSCERAWEIAPRPARRTSSTASSRSTASSASPGATGGSCTSWPGGRAAPTLPGPRPTIATILGERAADRRIETLQDRIHRLYAWWLIDKTSIRQQDQARDRRAARAPERRRRLARGRFRARARAPSTRPGSSPGRCSGSACRATIPALAKALRYLLAQQQDFGGWFQTTTHENFRTPMRETRYAVMALAEAFPRRRVRQHRGWGNRDDGPARLPRTDSLVHTLDDLENLWDVPEPDRPEFAAGDRPTARTSRAAGPRGGGGLPGPAGPGGVGRSPGSAARRSVQDRLASGGLGAAAARQPGHGRRRDQDRRSTIPIPRVAAGPPGSSPISSTAWTSASTWPIV